MKKFLEVLIIGLGLMLLISCAKPTVVDVVMPEDEKLNCEQLKDGFAETRRFKQEAVAVREVDTGGNMTRTVLFWPALLKTLHNADVAIRAANNRAYHLIDIMKNKNCEGIDGLYAELTNTTPATKVSSNDISEQLEKLNELYKSGALTESEYKEAKRKVLE